MIVDHAIGRIKFSRRMTETADHHNRCAGAPGEPGKAARQSDKEIGVLDPASTFGQRPVAGLILGAMRDVVPNDAGAVDALLVDTITR